MWSYFARVGKLAVIAYLATILVIVGMGIGGHLASADQISRQGKICVEKGNFGHTPMDGIWREVGSENQVIVEIDSSMTLRLSETTGELLECQVQHGSPIEQYRTDDLPDFLVNDNQFTWDLTPQGEVVQFRCRTASGLPGTLFYQWRIQCD